MVHLNDHHSHPYEVIHNPQTHGTHPHCHPHDHHHHHDDHHHHHDDHHHHHDDHPICYDDYEIHITSKPGPEGPQGPAGSQGLQGPTGERGRDGGLDAHELQQYLKDLGHNIIPSQDNYVNLGSANYRFGSIHTNEMYVSQNSVWIGGVKLSSNDKGELILPEKTRIGGLDTAALSLNVKGKVPTTSALP